MLINGLWIGDELPLMAKLTINSFVDHGYAFRLWTYNPNKIESQVQSGVDVENAGLIIPPENVFSYVGNGNCRKGSYAGFSDLFRYALLYQEGGIYVDMDVTCINRFEFTSYEYILRPHIKTGVCGNIIKVPKKSIIMRNCFLDMDRYVDETNANWYYPMELLRYYVIENNLDKYVVSPQIFGQDSQEEIEFMKNLYYNFAESDSYWNTLYTTKCAIHWCNDHLSNNTFNGGIKIDFQLPVYKTVYKKLLKQHGVI